MKDKVKSQARETLNFVGRMKMYFLRGHSSWFNLLFYFANFTLIFYNLLLEKLYFIPEWVSFWKFAVFFIVVYPPIAILVGRFDYRKGTYIGEQQINMAVNPLWKKNFQRMNELETQIHELKEIINELNSKK